MLRLTLNNKSKQGTSRQILQLLVLLVVVLMFSVSAEAQKKSSSVNRPGPGGFLPNPYEFDGNEPDSMQIRSETHIGCKTKKYSYAGEKETICVDGGTPEFPVMVDQFIKLPKGSDGFIDLPRAASKFVVNENNTVAAITFSAMSYVSDTTDEPLQIRVLVDGVEALPGPITLTGGMDQVLVAPSQSFTFLTEVDRGIHTVQVQYSTEHVTNGSSYIRNASIKVKTGKGITGDGEPEQLKIGTKNWTPVPNADINFYVPKGSETAITFSSVISMEQGDFIMLRAIIDNGAEEVYPKEIALAGRLYHTEARSVVFNAEDLPEGMHNVKFEWRGSETDVVAKGTISAWTVLVQTEENNSKDNFFDVVSQTELTSSTESHTTPVANLSTHVEVNEVSDIAVTLSGAFAGEGTIFIVPTLDGFPLMDQEVIIHYPTLTFQNPGDTKPQVNHAGGGSYTFGIKELSPKAGGYEVGVAYRVTQAGVTTPPAGYINDANLVVEKKLRIGPDLAEGPNMGRASKKYESIIEPIYGSRELLTIIIDPQIEDSPADTMFFVDVDDFLHGGFQSVKDYFMLNSGGRFQVNKAGTLGIFTAANAGQITNDKNYYLDSENFDCENGATYGSGSDALHAEALKFAEGMIDFKSYDRNKDEMITPDELGIIVAIPRSGNAGSSIKTSFAPFCDEDNETLSVDGVRITETVHLNLIFKAEPLDQSDKIQNMMVAAHELAHHWLGLDDAYGRYKGLHDGVQFSALPSFMSDCPDEEDLAPGETCQNRYMNTAPHMISLMTFKTGKDLATPHLHGFHKLHLGWVTPHVIEENDKYDLSDVKQSEKVYILPRRYDDGLEYVLLETRIQENSINTPLYDYNINDSGLAVYHVIEPNDACKSAIGAVAPDCKPLQNPVCIPNHEWLNKHASNYVRVGVRLIQPDFAHIYDFISNDSGDDYAEFKQTLFGQAVGGMDLLDAGTLSCPLSIGDPLPLGSEPLLLWSNGDPSGYNLLGIKTDFLTNSTFSLNNTN